MALFPSVDYQTPFVVSLRYKTLVTAFDELGREQRKRKWIYPRRDITIRFRNIKFADMKTLWQFYMARSGPYEAFNIFLPYSDVYTGEFVGEGDGSTTIFNLPAKTSSSYTVYVEGSEMTEDVDYTFSALGGTDGADKITFTSAPTNGFIVTYDFTGYLKVHCRFNDDLFDMEQLYQAIANMGVRLRGLLNA